MGLRVGLVGYGEIAQYHERHLRAAGACVVGAVTRRETSPGVRRYHALEAMLPHVDALTIAVPNHLHAAFCVAALEAGKPVFVEKPLCVRAEELAVLQAGLPAARAPVHVGFRLRWNPRLRGFRDRLVGVRRVRCVYRLGIERLAAGKPWTRIRAESGGAFFTLGVHALDLARWLAGARGEPLRDLVSTQQCRDQAADFPLVASLHGVLPGGVEITAEVDLRGAEPFRLTIDVDAENPVSMLDPTLAGPAPEEPGAADVEYAGLMAHFIRAATCGERRADEIAEALECHRTLIAAASENLTRPSQQEASMPGVSPGD